MKDWDGLIIFFLVATVAVLMFFGVITAVKKSMKGIPDPELVNSKQQLEEQKERNRLIKERQKKLMRDNQQRYQDYRNRSGGF